MIRTIEGIEYKLVIPFHILEKTSLAVLYKESKPMKELNGGMKLMINAQSDNHRTFLELDGYYHSCIIIKDKDDYFINIWDQRGSITLISEKIKVENNEHPQLNFEIPVIAASQRNKIKKVLRDWNIERLVPCSKCGMKHKDLNRFWFSATYCQECWETVKQKALSENYE